MNTAKRTIAPETSQVYDGFISYSHAADDLLAPRLQSGLQRFAKPWWKRRALRIFRDESSLSANPHLWSSITEALDQSGWFVLLLSPDAASSEWVNQEIEYWRQHKEPSRVLPVLTDGTFEWAGGDISGSASPEQLRGSFTEEPRWVDMRFARDETDLDLKDPRFADAVADIASTLRGVPKDELASEEVKQHRRTIRTAWGAASLVGLLAVAAVVFAIQSADNARFARSRELSASALNVLGSDPELAALLALESHRVSGDELHAETEDILRAARHRDHVLRRFDFFTGDIEENARISADGQHLVITDPVGGRVVLAEYESGKAVWEFHDPVLEGQFLSADTSPDSSLVVVSAHLHGGHGHGEAGDSGDHEEATHTNEAGEATREASHDDDHDKADHHGDEPATLIVLDGANGEVLHLLAAGECDGFILNQHHYAFSPDGAFLAARSGTHDCTSGAPEADWLELWDTSSWEIAHRIDIGRQEQIVFAANSTWAMVTAVDSNPIVIDLGSMEKVAEISGEIGSIDPGGDLVAVADWGSRDGLIRVVDLGSGDDIALLHGWEGGLGRSIYFSASGRHLAVETDTGDVSVWEIASGERTSVHSGSVSFGLSMHPDGRRFISNQGSVIEFEIPGSDELSAPNSAGTLLYGIGAGNGVDFHDALVTSTGIGIAVGETAHGERVLRAFRLATGEVLDEIEGERASPVGEDRFAVITPLPNGAGAPQLALWDPQARELHHRDLCSHSESPSQCEAAGFNPSTAAASTLTGELAAYSPTGVLIVTKPESSSGEVIPLPRTPWRILEIANDWVLVDPEVDDRFLIIDRSSGDSIAEIAPGASPVWASLVSDESLMVLTRGGGLWTYDIATWEASPQLSVHDATVLQGALSPSGDLLAIVGSDGSIRIWDIQTQKEVGRLRSEGAVDVSWLSGSRLGVLAANGSWQIEPLKADNLLAEVREQVSRTFTHQECETYRIDPCPTG